LGSQKVGPIAVNLELAARSFDQWLQRPCAVLGRSKQYDWDCRPYSVTGMSATARYGDNSHGGKSVGQACDTQFQVLERTKLTLSHRKFTESFSFLRVKDVTALRFLRVVVTFDRTSDSVEIFPPWLPNYRRLRLCGARAESVPEPPVRARP
jgi:hypothetical protein